MPCPEIDPKIRSEKMKAKIAALFASGNAKAAFIHRFAQCCHATECGRLCERMVKSPGKAAVYCWNPLTDVKTPLYPALERLEFQCPKELFQ